MNRFALVLLMAALGAAEPDTGWRFPLNKALFYQYQHSQDVVWRSGGDDLAYRSGMTWIFALKATAITGTTATVNATIIRIRATLDGPAAEVVVDSRDPRSANDPVYGHLIGLAEVTLTLTVDQPTGQVSAVVGGDELIKRINARHPSSVPGDPPPFAAAAKQLYSSDALAAWWSQILVQPAREPQDVPLAPPLQGKLRRSWNGDRFILGLPDGISGLPVQLVEGTNAVAGTLSKVAGSGQLEMANGLLTGAKGELTYALTLNALTQAVEQRHKQEWSISTWAPTPDMLAPNPGPDKPADAALPPSPPGVTHP